jgi:hypothetical protein
MCLFQVLGETFPKHTFLMNGLVQGVKVQIKIITIRLFLGNLMSYWVYQNKN